MALALQRSAAPTVGRTIYMRSNSLAAIAVAIAAVLATPLAASAEVLHTIAPGESLSSIAATDGLSVAALAAANGLSPDAEVEAGTTIVIPASDSVAGAPSTEAPAAASYVVQPGDTLSAIAATDGVSAQELAAANGIELEALLPAGTTLVLPAAGLDAAPTAATSEDPEAAYRDEAAPSEADDAETPSSAEVGEIAEQNGVPAAFAEAIAEQESGFDNGAISSVGARGVMQILPGTWTWIDDSLAGTTPLASESASENVRAGTLMLNVLLDESGGDAALAAADYYQGSASVREHGEYPETERYVEDVLALEQGYEG